MKNVEVKYYQSDMEKIFQKLISGWDELIEFYNTEVKFDYDDINDRIDYADIGDIAHFIVDKKKSGQTEKFDQFFKNAEDIIIHGEHYVKELIIIGLFEGIQNIGTSEIDYYRSFDKWLRKNSLKAWRELIDYWEGDDWKQTSESQKNLVKNDDN